MDGTVIFQNFPNALAPSTLAASYKSSETPLNAAVIIIDVYKRQLTYPIECYFPTWVIPEDHDVTKALEDAYKNLFGNERIGVPATEEMRKARPLTDKWTFSTNGVSIMGRNGIPCIGFGPGAEAQAHAPNEITWKQDLVTCAAVYAALPTVYCK